MAPIREETASFPNSPKKDLNSNQGIYFPRTKNLGNCSFLEIEKRTNGFPNFGNFKITKIWEPPVLKLFKFLFPKLINVAINILRIWEPAWFLEKKKEGLRSRMAEPSSHDF